MIRISGYASPPPLARPKSFTLPTGRHNLITQGQPHRVAHEQLPLRWPSWRATQTRGGSGKIHWISVGCPLSVVREILWLAVAVIGVGVAGDAHGCNRQASLEAHAPPGAWPSMTHSRLKG
jgi:hypothetical protein